MSAKYSIPNAIIALQKTLQNEIKQVFIWLRFVEERIPEDNKDLFIKSSKTETEKHFIFKTLLPISHLSFSHSSNLFLTLLLKRYILS